MAIEKVYEELDEIKAENEKLRAEIITKAELCERLKKIQDGQATKIREASSRMEKQEQQLLEKEEELSVVKQANEDLKSSLNEKESIFQHLNAGIDKLRAERGEKTHKWEQENRSLVLALDEANEKGIDQEQQINVLKAEIEGLKAQLSFSQKKCSEAEKKAKTSKESREDDLLNKVEEDKRKVEDQLKWKKEQFKHLEEAHNKLRDKFKASKKEWEKEKSTLLDEISSLQTRLDSQIWITGDLQNRLQMCNQALAHEETRRKHLEVDISEFKTCYENIFSECQDTKLQLECLNSQRDDEVASLRHLLETKKSFYKEMEYRAGRLEQENQELLTSLKDIQEANIQKTGSSSSLSKLKNKLKSVEQIHKECTANLKAKEAEWNSQREEMTRKLNDYSSQLDGKDTALKVLEIEIEGCFSSALQFQLQNEELSVMLVLFKSALSEAQLKLANVEAELGIHEKERVEDLSLLRQQLEMKNTALANAQRDIAEEREKTAILSKKLDTLYQLEDKHQLMQKELDRCKEMLEESSRCQLWLKELALQVDKDSVEKNREICDALDVANSKLAEERKKVASLASRVESVDLIEGQRLLMQEEMEKYKEQLEEASRCQIHLEEQALQMESEYKEKLGEVCDALETAKSELTEEREKTSSLMNRVEYVDHIEEQWYQTQEELERYKKMLDEASRRSKLQLEEQELHMNDDQLGDKLREISEALEIAKLELAEKHEVTASLLQRIKSSNHLEEQWSLSKEEVDRYKELLEESSRHQLQLEEQLSHVVDHDSERKLTDISNALEIANSKLVEKIYEGHEIEFELWLWKSIAERLKVDLEESQELRKELEASLLAQVEFGETIKQDKNDLARINQEKERKIVDLEQLIVSLEHELKTRELEAVSSAADSILQITREQDTILESLQKEIALLEEESLRRELEGAAFAHIGAERNSEHEKENLLQLVKEKDHRIDGLMQAVKSMEEDFNSSLNAFYSELAEKEAEINLVHEAWEKIAGAEMLAQVEIEEKKLMIEELEDDIHNIQEKLLLQEKSLSDSNQLAMTVEAELEDKQLEMKNLTDQMEERLRLSDTLVDELKSEKTNLLGDIMKLSMQRENLFGFIGDLGDKISEFSNKDELLMGTLGNIVQSFDSNNSDLKDCEELLDFLKENKNSQLPSPAAGKSDSIIEERSPFRPLN